MDCPHGLRIKPCALVGQVVSGHARNRGVPQLHRRDRFGNASRFVAVEGGRLSGIDLAEVASAGADVAADEECGFAVFPAFADVWASGLLADRMQASVCNLLADVGMIWTVTELRFDPGGLALDVSLRISDLKAQ